MWLCRDLTAYVCTCTVCVPPPFHSLWARRPLSGSWFASYAISRTCLPHPDAGNRLVALSEVPPTSDAAQNAVLMLPTDALSVLKVRSGPRVGR